MNKSDCSNLDVRADKVDGWYYTQARKVGANHADILAAHAAGANMWHYAIAREAGATHEEFMEACAGGAQGDLP